MASALKRGPSGAGAGGVAAPPSLEPSEARSGGAGGGAGPGAGSAPGSAPGSTLGAVLSAHEGVLTAAPALPRRPISPTLGVTMSGADGATAATAGSARERAGHSARPCPPHSDDCAAIPILSTRLCPSVAVPAPAPAISRRSSPTSRSQVATRNPRFSELRRNSATSSRTRPCRSSQVARSSPLSWRRVGEWTSSALSLEILERRRFLSWSCRSLMCVSIEASFASMSLPPWARSIAVLASRSAASWNFASSASRRSESPRSCCCAATTRSTWSACDAICCLSWWWSCSTSVSSVSHLADSSRSCCCAAPMAPSWPSSCAAVCL
mmetsp:Transcript_58399/g.164920  ORF Transcript_58399/g.164920 Transcript_58399/m.164920 type:complete len:325 (-) Transcript_58399:18-992(-)